MTSLKFCRLCKHFNAPHIWRHVACREISSLSAYHHATGSWDCVIGKPWTENMINTRLLAKKKTWAYTPISGSISSSSITEDDNWFSNNDEKMYKTHRPTTVLQKSILTVGAAFMSFYDPYRHDMVAVLGETTGYLALKKLHSKMLKHPEGQQILQERPRINSRTVNMTELSQMPDGTLGKEYHRFMTKNNITADSRAAVQYVDDPQLAYVLQRYRETHDFYHCLLGMPTTMLGEVVVKWFEMINTRLPMCALGALVGPLRLSAKRRKKLREHYIPQVIKMASNSELLLNCYFEKRWEDSVDDVRKDFKLNTIPRS